MFEQGIRNSSSATTRRSTGNASDPFKGKSICKSKLQATPGARTTSAGYSGTPNKFGHPGLGVTAPRRNHDRSNLSLRHRSASTRAARACKGAGVSRPEPLRGLRAGRRLPPPPHLPASPAAGEPTKRAGDREGEGHPAPNAAGRSGGGGCAGGGEERGPHGAGVTPRANARAGTRAPTRSITPARTRILTHPPRSPLPSMEKMKSLAVWISSAL